MHAACHARARDNPGRGVGEYTSGTEARAGRSEHVGTYGHRAVHTRACTDRLLCTMERVRFAFAECDGDATSGAETRAGGRDNADTRTYWYARASFSGHTRACTDELLCTMEHRRVVFFLRQRVLHVWVVHVTKARALPPVRGGAEICKSIAAIIAGVKPCATAQACTSMRIFLIGQADRGAADQHNELRFAARDRRVVRRIHRCVARIARAIIMRSARHRSSARVPRRDT